MMFQSRKFLPALLASFAVAAMAPFLSAQAQTGEWTLSQSDDQGNVRFSLQSSKDGKHSNTSSDWNASDFHGLDWSTPGRHDVRFTISRDAGTIECEGFLKGREGAGLFTFRPNPQYSSEMQALGFPGVSSEEQFAFAIHDVSLAFARQMKSAGIQDLDADKLIAFRIHGVTVEFVHDIRAAGLSVNEADKLIAFRIHGVSPEFIQQLQRLGYSHPDPDQLIAMRIHGVTPDYVASLRAHGMHNLTLEQLVSLRIHGIN